MRDLLVGDICHIKYGDSVPADGIVLQASDLKIDESAMTGETNLLDKTPNRDYRLIAGEWSISCQIMIAIVNVTVTVIFLRNQCNGGKR